MERVLIGGLTGALLSILYYVWNSNNFTKKQRIFLLICIIFPPAQWFSIIIILIYNKYKLENSAEMVSNRKLEKNKIELKLSIEDLLDLKIKGILTDNEYKEKVANIESQRIEAEFTNSTQYKQLKKLFENDYLTKNEFENKVKLLQNDEKLKNALKSDNPKNTDSLQIIYRETTENKSLKIFLENNHFIGAKVIMDDLPAPDGAYDYKLETHKLLIENGEIKEIYLALGKIKVENGMIVRI